MSSSKLRAHPDVVCRRVRDELVLVNLKTNRIYSVNETGARIWELLVAGYTRDALERQLIREFEVDELTLRREVDAHLAELAREGLLA